MPKDDPLGQRYVKRTLWLDRVNMAEARSNYFAAWMNSDQRPAGYRSGEGLNAVQQQEVWYTAWAAAIAAFDYLQNGRVEPY